MDKPTLERQVEALAVARAHAPPHADFEAIDQAMKVISWVQRNPEVIKGAVMLLNNEAVKRVREAFPDAELVDIRDREEG